MKKSFEAGSHKGQLHESLVSVSEFIKVAGKPPHFLEPAKEPFGDVSPAVQLFAHFRWPSLFSATISRSQAPSG
nr:hypothetical protein [Pontibacter chinhatensis]